MIRARRWSNWSVVQIGWHRARRWVGQLHSCLCNTFSLKGCLRGTPLKLGEKSQRHMCKEWGKTTVHGYLDFPRSWYSEIPFIPLCYWRKSWPWSVWKVPRQSTSIYQSLSIYLVLTEHKKICHELSPQETGIRVPGKQAWKSESSVACAPGHTAAPGTTVQVGLGGWGTTSSFLSVALHMLSPSSSPLPNPLSLGPFWLFRVWFQSSKDAQEMLSLNVFTTFKGWIWP